MKIIHIVDSLPFYVGGVSDYAYRLSSKLKNQYNIDSYFITVKDFHNFDRSRFNNIYNIYKKKNLYQTVKQIIDKDFNQDDKITIILEFVGYAYQKRGCPIWLLKELKKLKKSYPIHLITMFHELYAVSNNIKTSTFWLSWLQKYITKEIFFLSNSVKTNTIKYYKELKEWDNTKDIDTLPVFSNVGESLPKIEFNSRKNSVVIFGSNVSRNNVYKHKDFNQSLLDKFNINTIIDIGSGDIVNPNLNVKFIKLGRLDIEDVEKIMLESKFGLLDYGTMPLEKSGILAAYMVHGVIPIVLSCYDKESLYIENRHYIKAHTDISSIDFYKMSDYIATFYIKNASIKNHAKSYLKDIMR